MDSRSGAISFGIAQRGTQGGERACAGEGGKEQAVGAQSTPDQCQRAWKIADAVEHARGNDQIKARIAKRKTILVRLNPTGPCGEERSGIASRDPCTQGRAEGGVEATQVEHILELARHCMKPFLDAIQHRGAQKIMRAEAGGGAIAPPATCAAVKKVWNAHGRACAAGCVARQGCVTRLLAPLRFIADFALPPRCPGCGAVTADDHRFCAACWAQLRFLGPPWCAACNLPFSFDRGPGALCGKCHQKPPRHAGVRAAVAYGDIARTVVLRLKHGGRTAFAETVARQMARMMPDGTEMLIPVPLHRWRIWSRGFNQAALISAALTRATRVPSDPFALRRIRATPMLRSIGARGRAKVVTGAFAMAPGASYRVRGKAVVLVDDVHTSGATTDACTAALLRAGAASVTILCWARVLDPSADD